MGRDRNSVPDCCRICPALSVRMDRPIRIGCLARSSERKRLGTPQAWLLEFNTIFVSRILVHQGFSKNFIAAKAAGILALQLFVLGVFYAYTSVTHTEIPMVDIAAYIIGSFICQIVGYLILTSGKLPTAVTILSVIFLLAHAVLLVVFTFAPPEGHMFKESTAPLMGNLSKDTGFTFRCC